MVRMTKKTLEKQACHDNSGVNLGGMSISCSRDEAVRFLPRNGNHAHWFFFGPRDIYVLVELTLKKNEENHTSFSFVRLIFR